MVTDNPTLADAISEHYAGMSSLPADTRSPYLLQGAHPCPDAAGSGVINHPPWRWDMATALAWPVEAFLAAGGWLVLGENILYGRHLPAAGASLTAAHVIEVLGSGVDTPSLVRFASQTLEIHQMDIATQGLIMPYDDHTLGKRGMTQ